ncbi:Protein msta, isoform A [Orchesella cincta]|uniref:Protein msta, isoform A n=1 Tax=Orchesella cincta TaxID=48709 RepID=A0A1D2N4U3_ORCCI|nr:Protein msta, isoform A [Orchesella cincta]
MPDHANYECKIFAESPVNPVVNPPEYEKIKILRILLLKEKCPEKWELIRSLESRETIRRQNFCAVTTDIALYKFIKQECHLTQFDFDELHHVAGVSSIHSFPTNCPDVSDSSNHVSAARYASLLFYNASLLAHDCFPNTRYAIHASPGKNSSYSISVIATRNIEEGEPVTTSYVDPTLGTFERREILRERYYITCSCKRCSDASEFGTFFSAIKCKNLDCHTGYLLPVFPLDPNSEWRCNKNCCEMSTSPAWIASLIQEVRSQASISHSWETFDDMLEKYRTTVLHRNHYLVVEMQAELLKMIEKFLHKVESTQQIPLAKKMVELSRSCLAVMDVVYPGCNTFRGRLLYYLHEGLLALCSSRVNECADKTDQEIVRKSCKKYFVESLEIIREAREILIFEAVGTVDWKNGTMLSTESPRIKSLMAFFSFKN